jgi:V/A-type H+-transporting ATPase subunit I
MDMQIDVFNKYIEELDREKIYTECRLYDQRLNDNKNEQNKIDMFLKSLEPWSGLDIKLNMLEDLKIASAQIGSLNLNDSNEFIGELGRELPDAHIEIIKQVKDNYYIFLLCHRADFDSLNGLLKKYGWNRVQLPGEGKPAELIKSAKQEKLLKEEEYESILNEAGYLVDSILPLKTAYDYLNNEIEKKKVSASIGRTRKAFVLEGWVPADGLEAMEKAVSDVTDAYVLTSSDPGEDDDVPTAVRNNWFVEPYEVITDQYSVPGYRGTDPNPYIAPFYFLFFGMMLADAGYGAVMAVLCWIYMKLGKLEGGTRKFLMLLFYGGISSTFWGVMFGSYFGNAIKLNPIWFNPVDDPIKLLIFSLILGVVHIFVGLGLKAYLLIRDGKVWDAVFDIGFWYAVIIGSLMLALPATAPFGKYIAIGGALGLVLTQGRSNKNIIKRFLSGVLSLYGVTGYLGDILSYSRILALGLASGLIGLVINTMIAMFGGGIIGYLLGSVLFLGGHAFNLAVSTLSAYVHTTRLQYLEFFGKFYDGGGRAFKPLKLKPNL